MQWINQNSKQAMPNTGKHNTGTSAKHWDLITHKQPNDSRICVCKVRAVVVKHLLGWYTTCFCRLLKAQYRYITFLINTTPPLWTKKMHLKHRSAWVLQTSCHIWWPWIMLNSENYNNTSLMSYHIFYQASFCLTSSFMYTATDVCCAHSRRKHVIITSIKNS